MVINPIETIPDAKTTLNAPVARARNDVTAIKMVSNQDVKM